MLKGGQHGWYLHTFLFRSVILYLLGGEDIRKKFMNKSSKSTYLGILVSCIFFFVRTGFCMSGYLRQGDVMKNPSYPENTGRESNPA